MTEFPNQPSPRKQILKYFALALLAFLVMLLLAGVFVYFQAVRRFEVRRVSLPTRIYADLFPLRPGVYVSAPALMGKLRRLGYREIDETPGEPGEYAEEGKEIDIFLRAFEHPAGEFAAQRVRVVFVERSIESVISVPEGEPVETAALEPELLTSILGDQLESRTPVNLEQIPQHLVDAVISTEDARFFHHPGVDPIGILRAALRNVRARGVSEGGSTLTQQLVKNYYLTNERTLRRKVVEAFMAVVLDYRYSKEEILESYMNDIYLGRDRSISILGMGQAARFYFGKPISEVAIGEAALLAGIIRSPNNYSPFDEPEEARQRRNQVLDLMLGREKITREQYDQARAEPLPESPTRERTGLGSIPFYVNAVLEELERDYGIEDARGRGLALYTAIDLAWQNDAAEQLEQGLARLERSSRRLRREDQPLEGAILAVDVESGEIRALVGGRDYSRSQFNRALHAQRQVGSLIKPLVFLAAFEPSLSGKNITPATLVNDSRFVLERRFAKDWSPRNYEGIYRGVVTARQALEQSLNAASVRIGLAAGVDAIITTARALGIDSEMDAQPSLILGAVEVPPIQIAEAYTTIARMGSRVPLHTIRYVVSDRGKTTAAGDDLEPVQVFPARDAYLGVFLMEGVLRRGTAARARSLGFRKTAAGKTGTTNDKRDSWFIGFTPKTLALTWVGFDDNAPIGLSGSDGAVPIWARLMTKLTEGEGEADFPMPPGISFSVVDMTSGGLATPYCPDDVIIHEAFKTGTQPMVWCQKHKPPPIQIPPLDPNDPALGGIDGLDNTADPFREVPELEGGIFKETPPRPRTIPPPTTTEVPPFPERQPLPPEEPEDPPR